jgi:L-asparaginase / beta-aspartyl-peptidase
MRLFIAVLLLLLAPIAEAQPTTEAGPATVPARGPVAIAIHGGAGTILRANMTPEREAQYRAALEEALRAGHAVLTRGGAALDAVTAAIQVMEASPLFNAGVGAVLTDAGTAELDAAIMDGATRRAGAVAGVRTVRSPVALARRVMDASPHVLMMGEGAEAFAREQGFELVPNETFITPQRREQLRVLQQQRRTGQADPPYAPDPFGMIEQKYGTVGAVALDAEGHLAAATSTGGLMGKRFGRVGDAPIIGAGTYAEDETCAVSATGTGEFFIRGVVAHDVASMMRYAGLSLKEAANAVVMGRLLALGGDGGLISMDRQGNIALVFNTPGMYRGSIDTAGRLTTGIYRDDR